jgi:hypothetical protein
VAESDRALDSVLEGVTKGGGWKPPPKPPPGDSALDNVLKDLSPREEKLVRSLAATAPGESGTLASGVADLLSFGGSLAAGKALTALASRVGLPAAGRFLTGAAGGLARLPSLATSGAWQGALGAQVNRMFGQETPTGEAAAIGAGVNALTGGVGGALFGNRISQEAAQSAQGVRAAGIPLKLGNVPGSSLAARLAGKLSGATKPDVQELTRHIMRSVGSDADVLTGESLAAAKARLQGSRGDPVAGIPPTQGEFDRIASSARPLTWQNTGNLRGELANILAEAQSRYGLMQQPDEMRRVVGQVQNVVDGLNSGAITGEQLQALTSMNSGLSALASGGTAGAPLAARLKGALYSALAVADPSTKEALSLARNQYRNVMMLEPKVEQLTDANGLVDPGKLSTRIRSSYGNYEQASNAAASAGQPVDLGALGTAGQRFGQQSVARPSGPALLGLSTGLGAFGAEELAAGFPLAENLMHHPLLSLGASAGMLGGVVPIGALQNTNLMTDFLLSRASRGAGPLLSGANPLIGPGVMAAGRNAPSPSAPVPSRVGSLQGADANWDNWLRAQAFLESPSGAPSKLSSAKGYFQFLDGTARQALSAGLPNPQEGGYPEQASATKQFIQHFYPRAAAAINDGDYPTAVRLLAPVWPSLPGGSQEQGPGQYAQWNKILSAGGAS